MGENFGQFALTLAGTVVGAYFGNPQLGFALGSLAGRALFPTQLPEQVGPRLQDLRTTTSVVGSPILRGFGTFPTPGVVMWLGPVREIATTESLGGKGAPEQSVTSFSYTQPIALELGEGIIGGIVYIEENGELVYDRRPQGDAESGVAYAARVLKSDEYAETFTLYPGTEDQLPDPTLELYEGVGNVPAFRGIAYMVYHERSLRDDQARRHPNFKIVVTDNNEDHEIYASEVLFPWGQASLPLNPKNDHFFQANASSTGGYSPPNGSDLQALIDYHDVQWPAADFYGYSVGSLFDGINYHSHWDATAISTETRFIYLAYTVDDSLPALQFEVHAPTIVQPFGVTMYCFSSLDPYDNTSGNLTILCERRPQPPPGDGWTVINSDAAALAKVVYEPDATYGNVLTAYPVNPVLPDGHPLYNDQEFWEAAYRIAVGRGEMRAGMIYGEYPVILPFSGTRKAYVRTVPAGVAQPVSLADIITQICASVGVTDIDVTDLVPDLIDGYVLTGPMSARSAIEPLRSVGFFDVVESGGVVKFPRRGKAPAATLTDVDLGAHMAGSEAPPIVTTRKLQDPELPRQIRLKYLSIERGYEDGQQPSPMRGTAQSLNDIDIVVPVCMPDDRARRCAEVIWLDAWASRWAQQIALDQRWPELEPADVILIPVENRLQRVRILSDQCASTILHSLEGVRDDDQSYVSAAVASGSHTATPTMSIRSQTDLVLLDLPLLRDQDNDAGIYGAARRLSSALHWNGAVVQHSRGMDGSFSVIASTNAEARIGTVSTPLDVGTSATWDESQDLIVQMQSGDLQSRSEADVMGGANAAAIGAHGRWEIVQFVTAVETAPNTWRLSKLLRGRRGTEHVMGSGLAGDRFVLISGPGLMRLSLQTSDIGQSQAFRAITAGDPSTSGVEQSLTPSGMALLPFSPVSITGTRDGLDNLTIAWLRRDRIGQELRSGADLAMSEATEAYQIDILDGSSPPNVLRTLTSSVEQVIYTAADQTTDLGAPSDQIPVHIFQMSASVGRGTPGEAIV